jgi:Helix-turn-helix domain
MSIRMIDRVWTAAPTNEPAVLLVMLALADWANDEGFCWPAIESIGKKCRIGPRTVQRILRELKATGLLEVTGKGGRNKPNLYHLMVPERVTSTTPFSSTNGDTAMTPFKRERVTATTPFNSERVSTEVVKGDTALSPEPSLEPSRSKPLPADAGMATAGAGKQTKKPDLRFGPIRERIFESHRKRFGIDPTWGGREAGSLARWLRESPAVPLERVLLMVDNVYASDRDPGRPGSWLCDLGRWANAALDSYGKPKASTRVIRGQTLDERLQAEGWGTYQ